jgi:hypothetical protein
MLLKIFNFIIALQKEIIGLINEMKNMKITNKINSDQIRLQFDQKLLAINSAILSMNSAIFTSNSTIFQVNNFTYIIL